MTTSKLRIHKINKNPGGGFAVNNCTYHNNTSTSTHFLMLFLFENNRHLQMGC